MPAPIRRGHGSPQPSPRPSSTATSHRTMRQSRKVAIRHHRPRPKTPPSASRKSKGINVTNEFQVVSASPPPRPPPQMASYVPDQPRRPTIKGVENMQDDVASRPEMQIRPLTSGKAVVTGDTHSTAPKPEPGRNLGTRFIEDPRWRNSYEPTRPKTPDTLKSIPIADAWQSHLGDPAGYRSLQPHIQDRNTGSSGNIGRLTSGPIQGAGLRTRGDNNSVVAKHPFCGVPSTRTWTFGLSEHNLRQHTGFKRWLSKSIHRKDTGDDAAPSPIVKIRRGGIPYHIQRLAGRPLRSHKKTEDLRSPGRLADDQVVDLNHLDESEPAPRHPSSIINPLHDPEADRRFSMGWKEDWAGKLEDQMNRIDGEEVVRETDDDKTKIIQGPHSEVRSGPSDVMTGSDAAAATLDRLRPRSPHRIGPAAARTDRTRSGDAPELASNLEHDNDTAPSITITAVQSVKYPTPPRPGPRTSSRVGARLGHMMRSGCTVDAFEGASPSLPDHLSEKNAGGSQLAPDGLQVQRTLSNASSTATRVGPSPSKSVDTLSKIEAQVQNSHPARFDTDESPPRHPRLSSQLDNGPSGEPPERPLPDLPENHEQILADDSRSSRASSRSRPRRNSRPARSSTSHKRQGASISSTTNTVRAFSPGAVPTRSHSTASKRTVVHNAGSPKNVTDLRLDLTNLGTSIDLRSPTSIYSQGSSISSQSITFKTTTTIHSARVDRVKAIRKRDLTSYAAQRRIDEEDEERPPLDPDQPIPASDPIDQFPGVPSSRPNSRTQSHHGRRTSYTHHRNTSTASRSAGPSVTPQPLRQSGIMIIADTDPVTSTFRAGAMSPTGQQPGLDASGRRQASMHELNEKFAHGKKPRARRSTQSIHRHHIHASTSLPRSTSVAPQTPPSSSGSEDGGTVVNDDDSTRQPLTTTVTTTLPAVSRREALEHIPHRLDELEEQLRRVHRQIDVLSRALKRGLMTTEDSRPLLQTSSLPAIPPPIRMARHHQHGIRPIPDHRRLSTISSHTEEASSSTLDTEMTLPELPPLPEWDHEYDMTKATKVWTGRAGRDRIDEILSTRDMDQMLRREF